MEALFNFFTATLVSQIINSIILLLLVFVLVRILQYLTILKREEKKLASIEDNLNAANNEDGFLLKLIDLAGDGIIHNRLIDINKIYERGRLILAESAEQVINNHRFPQGESLKRISGVLILFGLLGTVVGLGVSVIEIKNTVNNFGSAQINKLVDTISGFLNGMETAFSTTIVGMVATLIVLFLLYFYERKKWVLENRFNRLLITQIIPLMNTGKDEESITEMTVSIRENSGLLKQLVENTKRVSDDARQQYNLLVSAISSLTMNISSIKKPFEESNKIQEQILGISKDFKSGIEDLKQTTISMNDNIQRFIESSSKSNEVITQTIEQLKISHLDSEKLRESIGETNNTVDKLATGLDNWIVEMTQSTIVLKELAVTFAENSENSVKKVNESVHSLLTRISESVDRLIKNLQENKEDITKVYTEQVIKIIEGVQTSLVEHLEVVGVMFKDNHGKVFDEYKTQMLELNGKIERLFIHLHEYPEKLSTEIEEIHSAQREKLLGGLRSEQEKQKKAVGDSISELNRTTETLRRLFAKTSPGVQTNPQPPRPPEPPGEPGEGGQPPQKKRWWDFLGKKK